MQIFIAVATVAQCILLCAALGVEGASAPTGVTEANIPHIDTIFPELNVASPNLARAGENSPPINEGELLAARLDTIGVHDADGMGAALEDLGLLWSAFISPSPAPECVPAR